MSMMRLAAAAFAMAVAACSIVQGPEVREAFAPTGRLRVALFEGNAVHALRDRASGELRGVSHDLGKELAARLATPFEPVLFSSLGAMLDAGKAGAWDVAFLGVSPDRRQYLDFTGNHIEVEYGYLVPAGSSLSTREDVDRSGVRIAVVGRGTPDVFLTGVLRNAQLVRAAGLPGAVELVNARKAEAIGGQMPSMLGVALQIPGSRVIHGPPGSESIAMAMPKGRGASAAAYARSYIEEAKSTGRVKAAIERAGLRGVTVAVGE